MSQSFAARHTMETPEWYTPAPIIDAARAVMGAIDLDPASHEEANRVVQASSYFTEEDDGLKQLWLGRVFLNPPGGLVAEFWRKLITERDRGRVEQATWIGYSLEQLQTLQNVDAGAHPLHFAMCVPKRRIAFVENQARREARQAKEIAAGKKPTEKSSPSHANYITYIGANTHAFRHAFTPFGEVVLR